MRIRAPLFPLLLAGCIDLSASPLEPVRAPAPPGDPRRPAAVETEEVPPVPDSVFERLRQYNSVRSAAFLDWSPDGRGMLVSTRFGSTSQLHLVRKAGGRREQITFLEEPVSHGRFWPDGTVLFTSAGGGSENWQIFRLDPSAGRVTLLSDGRSRFGLEAFDRGGRRAVVSINRPGERDTDLHLFDPDNPASPELLKRAEGGFWSALDWSPDDTRILLSRFVSVNESHLHVLDVATRTLQEIPAPGGRASQAHARFAPDGRSVYVASDAAGEFRTLARIDLGTMEHEWLTPDIPWDVEDLEVSPDGSRIAFTVNEDGVSRLHFLQEGRRTSPELPAGIVSRLRFSPDGRRLGFSLNRPEAPGDAYSLEEGVLTRWTESELGGLDPATFVRPERISFESFDGLRIPAYVYRPRGSKRVPVIVSLHGGPEGQFRPWFSAITQFWVAELGCAVIGPNVRGSTGYGKRFVALDNAGRREDSVRDVGALLDWIARQPGLDDSRVAVIGGSYGGYMSLASLVHFGDRLRAGVDIVGIANFRTFLSATSAYRQDLRRAEYGDERDPEMREVFERISPVNRTDSIRSALLVAHGRNDPRVPFGEAVQIARAVRGRGRPVWTVFAANEGHGFEKRENRDYLNAVIAMFFQETLLK